jgi:hypothetical protein
MCNLAEAGGLSVEAYLTGEACSPVKHEYLAGGVFAMAAASEAHVTIAGNVLALLRAHVRGGPCRVSIAVMNGWILQPVPAQGRLHLLSLGFGCSLEDIFEDVPGQQA